ncbi:GNAT family N-acetyltransferase [Natronoarchaeum mannanilyticum]|uniref:GNAT family N-acetyltransferase n=2 Tax=Natronoarchaeum mannanilyticum TaxID=926360 RepID=A0AAV3TE32_9EURY
MTADYAISPQQIDAVVDDQFGRDRLEGSSGDADATYVVAETDDEVEESTVAGVVVGRVADAIGEIRWLFVDPEHRGKGIGTSLFEAARDELREDGAEELRMYPLEEATQGPQFAERLGFEQIGDREIEIGGESFVEYAYAEASGDEAESASGDAEPSASESGDAAGDSTESTTFPNTEERDGHRTTTTDDGEQLYVDTDDEQSGTAAAFFPVYEDEAFEERYGFYCGNCGSLDVSVDQMDRYECSECGNSHASRSDQSYDDSHL